MGQEGGEGVGGKGMGKGELYLSWGCDYSVGQRGVYIVPGRGITPLFPSPLTLPSLSPSHTVPSFSLPFPLFGFDLI